MANTLIRAELHRTSQDDTVNDWSFIGEPAAGDHEELTDIVAWFYRNGADGQIHALEYYLSDEIISYTIKAFRVPVGPAPILGSPLYSKDYARLNHPGVAALPSETALVLSTHADRTGLQEEVGNTRPRARKQGRLYVGPLSRNADGGGSPSRPSGGFQADLVLAAGKVMVDATNAGFPWAVWSRTNADFNAIIGGFVDDAWDTVRSRGVDRTGRVLWGSAA